MPHNVAFVGVALAIALLLCQLNAAVGADTNQRRPPRSASPFLTGPEDKLHGFDLGKDDSSQPIMQERPIGTRHKRIQRVPSRFIVQVAAKPAAMAMAEQDTPAATAASADSTQRAQVMARTVVSQVDAVAASAGITAKVTRKYTHALSGFVVTGPTPNELRALTANPNVVAIWKVEMLKVATYTTPKFLGLTSKLGESPHAHQAELMGRPPKTPSRRGGKRGDDPGYKQPDYYGSDGDDAYKHHDDGYGKGSHDYNGYKDPVSPPADGYGYKDTSRQLAGGSKDQGTPGKDGSNKDGPGSQQTADGKGQGTQPKLDNKDPVSQPAGDSPDQGTQHKDDKKDQETQHKDVYGYKGQGSKHDSYKEPPSKHGDYNYKDPGSQHDNYNYKDQGSQHDSYQGPQNDVYDSYDEGYKSDKHHDYDGTQEKEYVWDQLGGVVGPDGAGENVVVGVIDTGVWLQDHPSFVDRNYWNTGGYGSYGQTYAPLPGWKGTCQRGEGGAAFGCNHKVIGCRWYNDDWVSAGQDIMELFPYESLSCRDMDGHGTHTASTAAGNYGAASPFTPPGALLSGMAPRARISVYKVCWGRDEWYAGCGTGDILAAIDDAMQDGVNIISMSLGSSPGDTFAGPFDLGLMNAAGAGVFVSAAGGNSGPDQGTVDNLGPWITTVAASTLPRTVVGTAILGNGQVLHGSSPANQAPLGPLPVIYAGNAGINDTVPAATCGADSLKPELVTGRIVVCDILNSGLLSMVAEVSRAGGVAVIAALRPEAINTTRRGRREYLTALPYVQLGASERETVLSYLFSTDSPSASFAASEFSFHNTAPEMALFSSRGPTITVKQLVLKPDITGPGVNIQAAYSPSSPPAHVLYESLSGTSMSTPHLSGIAALIKDKHPDWPPSAIKSAIMTTAYQLTKTGDAGQPFGSPIDYGAGHVNPQAALNPGLVIMSTYRDWLNFMCKAEPYLGNYPPVQCPGSTPKSQLMSAEYAYGPSPPTPPSPPDYAYGPNPPSPPKPTPIDPACVNPLDINLPSISGIIAGATTYRRTLTAVFDEGAGNYSSWSSVQFKSMAAADAGSSFDIRVWPPEFAVSNGQEVPVLITVAAKPDTPMDVVQTGRIVWYSHKGHKVTIPVAVTFTTFMTLDGRVDQWLRFTPPASTDASSSQTYRISSSISQTVQLTAGLQPAAIDTAKVSAEAAAVFNITIPEGTDYAALALFSEDYPAGLDLDLFVSKTVCGPTCNETVLERVAGSIRPTASEFISTSKGLIPGDYVVEVEVYKPPEDFKPLDVYLYSWAITAGGANLTPGLLTVTPSHLDMVASDPCCCQVTATVTGINATADPVPNRYLGFITYTTGAQDDLGNTTVVVW